MNETHRDIIVRALRTTQVPGLDIFAFFIRGADIVQLADISRIDRDEHEVLKGFQRPEIRSHVKEIVDYLNKGSVLFPNAIILALSPQVKFSPSRGPKPEGLQDVANSGTLIIPVASTGEKMAWIVDGQQRSIALAQSSNTSISVPVIGFVTDDLELQREQFILVNKAKPLPTRLINELLPETRSILLPKELNNRKLPSELCGLLNRDTQSPFYKIIKRPSDKKGTESKGIISDMAVIAMIKNSLNNPLGALAPFKGGASEMMNIEAMYKILTTFWSAVKDVFPEAWEKDPRQSRLMHSAGIEAMGVLMDRIYAKLTGVAEDYKSVRAELERVAPFCRWTEGRWEFIGLAWNEIQNTPRDIKRLQDALVRAYIVTSTK